MKAMEMCRGKIKARKLPMEIVDAEYQWFSNTFMKSSLFRDRRKLTFYFVADKRIDFRELGISSIVTTLYIISEGAL